MEPVHNELSPLPIFVDPTAGAKQRTQKSKAGLSEDAVTIRSPKIEFFIREK